MNIAEKMKKYPAVLVFKEYERPSLEYILLFLSLANPKASFTTIVYFQLALTDKIPKKPSNGCPSNTKPGTDGNYCCCDEIEDCCWNKCPVEGTKENLEKLNQCGVEPDQWSFAKTGSSGEERVFIAQAGKIILDKLIFVQNGILLSNT